MRAAEAKLQPSQIQDFAVVMGDMLKARTDCELVFTLRVELGGKQPPNDEVVHQVGRILQGVSEEFRLA